MTRLAAFHVSLTLFFIATVSLAAAVETPFSGKDLSGWKTKQPASSSHWTVGTAALAEGNPRLLVVKEDGSELVNAQSHGVDIYTESKYGDVIIELEVMVPQRSNSGIYVMGEYEVQVFDSYGKEKPGMGDMGALYGAAPPRVNACKAPGEWQKYRIDFRAPRFDDAGKKIVNARFVKITLNGQVLHENLQMKGVSGGGVTGKEVSSGPLMFQGNHGAVAYRNIRITPIKTSE
jgi:hypothetical protein